MIDFENPTYLKLRPVQDSKLDRLVAPLLCPGEEIVQTFQSVRDGVVFTTRRVIAVNVQGVTGMKKAFTVLPYRRIQAYAIESAGLADLDGELQLWFSGLGPSALSCWPARTWPRCARPSSAGCDGPACPALNRQTAPFSAGTQRKREPSFYPSPAAWTRASSCSNVYSRLNTSSISFLESRGGRPRASSRRYLRSAAPAVPDRPQSYRST